MFRPEFSKNVLLDILSLVYLRPVCKWRDEAKIFSKVRSNFLNYYLHVARTKSCKKRTFGFIKRVDKGRIAAEKDLES